MVRPLRGLWFVWLGFACTTLVGQAQEDSVSWQIDLETHEVSSTWIRPFTTSGNMQSIDLTEATSTLADALRDQPAIYLRDYGNQQLSTISLRGTSPSHTQVLWHGLPVNSPALGQSDLSTWPTQLLNDLALHKGNSSSLYGSGAIGGALSLNQEIPTSSGTGWRAMVKQGSFGLWSGSLSSHYGNGTLQLSTKLSASTLANDFLIRSPRIRESIRQPHAHIESIGFSQSIGWNKGNQRWLGEWMYVKNDRQVQPGVTSLMQQNHLLTLASRIALTQEVRKAKWQPKTTIGWMHDETRYNDTLLTPSHQLCIVHRSNIVLHEDWMVQLGGLLQYAEVNSEQLATQATTTQVEPFVSASWFINPRLQLSGNSRWLVADYDQRWIPSAQLTWDQPTSKGALSYHASWARGYRLPTLNDLYWQPGGNPDLQPESSHQWESGLRLDHRQLRIGVTFFMIKMRQQIIWLPQDNSIWSPVNIRSSRNQGLEWEVRFSKQLKKLRYTTHAAGSLLSAVELPSADALPYVPTHQLRWQHLLTRDAWKVDLQASYTGSRPTILQGGEDLQLDPFVLIDVGLHYQASSILKSKDLLLTARVKNITNTYYELQSNLAMPGINYELQLSIN